MVCCFVRALERVGVSRLKGVRVVGRNSSEFST